MQGAGIERGNGDGDAKAGDKIGQHHVLGAKARGLHDVASMLALSVLESLHGVGQALAVPGRLAGVQSDGAHMDAPTCTNSGTCGAVESVLGRANRGCGWVTSPW